MRNVPCESASRDAFEPELGVLQPAVRLQQKKMRWSYGYRYIVLEGATGLELKLSVLRYGLELAHRE